MDDLDAIVSTVVEKGAHYVQERGKGAMGPLMGELMKTVGRGTVDGKILSQKLSAAIDKMIAGGDSAEQNSDNSSVKEKPAKKKSASPKEGGKKTSNKKKGGN